ncbi:MAG: transposase [Flavobacterium sp.]|uniref:transposase n=1 Tax=Flavobacterium sp. TaxID=239 RepID=UPI0022C65321|nr:transposase [Flavobacterium sp.]MCZ8198203.1 transposase [Flavobacterium sp.]
MTKFKNKYRIEPARLKNWDYAKSAAYYITICTANRKHFFGKIENEEMMYSEIGKIVELEWLKTPDIRPDMNIELGEFVVMPNHFHGIVFIGDNEFNGERDGERGGGRDAMHLVSTDDIYTNKFGPQSKNVSSIIRGFKSAVTIHARNINPEFGWQPRFYDRIIRDAKSYEVISKYIINNPKKWFEDAFNKSTTNDIHHPSR